MISAKRSPLSSYTILTFIALFIGFLNLLLPSGTFTYQSLKTHKVLSGDRAIPLKQITKDHLSPIQGSYHHLPHKRLTFKDFIQSPFIGAYEIMEFILFILVLGVFIEMIKSLHIFEKLCRLLLYLRCPPHILLIVFLFCLSLLSSITGLRDENIIFFTLLVPLLSHHGINPITTSMMILLSALIGTGSSILNPTIVGIFSSFSSQPLMEGFRDRILFWVLGFLIGAFLLWKKAPKNYEKSSLEPLFPKNTLRTFFAIITIMTAFIFLVRGLVLSDALIQTEGLLLFLSILAGILGGLSESEIVSCVKNGMQNLLPIAINMSLARGILYLMEKSEIRDTLLFWCFSLLGGDMPIFLFSFLFILLLTLGFFLINSTSAMASLSFPLFYPIFIALGIPYSTFIFWFLLAVAISQMLNPTGFLLNHIRRETSLSYIQWVYFSLPMAIFIFSLWIYSLFF